MNSKLTHWSKSIGWRLLACSQLCALLVACGPIGELDRSLDPTDRAQAMANRGDHNAAGRAYMDLAVKATGEQRQRYLIFAAGEFYQANDVEAAIRILEQAGREIAAANIEVWAEVAAEIRLAQNDPAGALQALNQVESTDRRSAADRILLLRAESLFQLNRPEAAVATLLQREQLLSGRATVEANRKLIWTGLQGAGASLPASPSRSADAVLAGWMQLGRLAFSERGSLTRLYASLDQWRRDNPTHPAAGNLLSEVLANLSALSNYPAQVALLLPLTGKQQSAGEAVRDGYLAAHFDIGSDGARPDVRIYDTERTGALAAYQQAISQGAQFIVGPLLREEVAAVFPALEPVSMLALNSIPESLQAPAGFYQFGLAPEDEARAVARRAAAEGLRNAVVFVPANDWGKRIQSAFEAELGQLGGTALALRTYREDAADFSALIQNALLLNESYARRERLEANLGRQVEFEPRRRQDVDYIFIAANPGIAKLLRPQLRFHYAGDIPTFATSAVYQPGAGDNSDLNDISFPDIPWLLNPTPDMQDYQETLSQYWGPGAIRGARFYALGYDAYRLTALLHGRSDVSNLDTAGSTGKLQLNRNGVIRRELSWARFERGRPRTLPDSTRSLTPETAILPLP